MSDDEYRDDDVPLADPQIQKDYEAALGDFLVRLNWIENTISDLIRMTLATLERCDLADKTINHSLNRRIENLELITLAFPDFPTLPKNEILELARDRNNLAHGHFEQNPFQGDYEIVGRGKTHAWTPDTIKPLSERADDLWYKLRHIEAFLEFRDVRLPDHTSTEY